jgi:hypothetical protein
MYEFLKDWWKNRTIRNLVAGGVIKMSAVDYLTYYDYYLTAKKTMSNEDAIKTSADFYNISPSTIRRAIKLMTSTNLKQN